METYFMWFFVLEDTGMLLGHGYHETFLKVSHAKYKVWYINDYFHIYP